MPDGSWNDNQKRILDAAADEFAMRGYDATTIDDIARHVGQTKGLIYYSFQSKIAIFFAVYERGMLELIDETTGNVLDATTGEERLRTAVVTHLRRLLDQPAYTTVIQMGLERSRHVAMKPEVVAALDDLVELRHRYEALIQSYIEAGIDDGTIRRVPVRLAVRTVVGAVLSVLHWYRIDPDQSAEERREMAEQVAALVIQGVAAPEPS